MPNKPAAQRETPSAIRRSLQVQQTSFIGPIPPPAVIADYERILPGSADRIFTMAEKQQTHRHSLETLVVQTNSQRESRGLVFAFIIAMTITVGALFLIFNDKQISGLVTLIGGIAGLVALFVRAQNQAQSERKTQREQLLKARPVTDKTPKNTE